MTQLAQLLTEKGIKSSEKLREECPLSNWEIAELLFKNLSMKCKKMGIIIEHKTTNKLIHNKKGRVVKIIHKKKMQRIKLPAMYSHEYNVAWSLASLWVKPIIQNNRIVLFYKGTYIDGATIFGESINRYQ